MADNTESKLKVINALVISLLSLSEAYELPEAVESVIQDLNNRVDCLISVT